MCVSGERLGDSGIWEIFVSPPQFCRKLKTALKNKVYKFLKCGTFMDIICTVIANSLFLHFQLPYVICSNYLDIWNKTNILYLSISTSLWLPKDKFLLS